MKIHAKFSSFQEVGLAHHSFSYPGNSAGVFLKAQSFYNFLPADSYSKSITFDIQKEEKAKPTREDYLDNPSDNLTSSEQLILSEILANNSTAIALLKLKDAKAKYFAENLIEEMKNE